MSISKQIAKHFRELYFGGNWTYSNFKENLSDLTWQQATTKVYSFNTIALLVFHTTYYINAALRVLDGFPLDANDKYSFDCPSVNSQEDWDNMLLSLWLNAEHFAKQVEKLPDSQLNEIFVEEKYGNYYRNLQGIIEHSHYHLGQIVILKNLILQLDNK